MPPETGGARRTGSEGGRESPGAVLGGPAARRHSALARRADGASMSSPNQDATSRRPPGYLSGLNVRERLGAVYRSGLPHLLLSIGSVQGLTYVSQVLLAKL